MGDIKKAGKLISTSTQGYTTGKLDRATSVMRSPVGADLPTFR